MLVNDFLLNSFYDFPDKEALVYSKERFTYEELNKKAENLSNFLLSLNILKSDRVIIFLENSVESVVSIFGILNAGGVFIVVNPLVKPKKLQYMINDSQTKILITDQQHFDQIKNVMNACPSLQTILLVDKKGEESNYDLENIDVFSFYDSNKSSSNHTFPEIIDVDLASIIYTSGSTGFPKGVTMTHRNMVFAADSIISYLNNRSDDVIFNVLPLSFDYGLYQVLMAFRFGGTVILEKSFGFQHQVLNRLSDEKATGFPIVPTIANLLLRIKDFEKYDLSHLRYITNTAQKLPKKTIFSLMKAFPDVEIYSMYGLTECKRVSYLPPEKLSNKPESVGQAIPGTEVFIVDKQGKRIDKSGVVGELVVRGSHIMSGYWNKPEETNKMIKQGKYPGDKWLFTGDYFLMDEENDLYFCGRKDDMIKTSGEKVSPKEIENVIYELNDVEEVAVIGVADELLGEAIKAFVSLKKDSDLDENKIIFYCSKRLERFMVPKYVEFLNRLPKTVTGKIRKKDLKD